MSPYEILAPYHEWVRDEMAKRLCHRLQLPAGEALHMAHCISQITNGLLAGSTGHNWTKHLLHTKSRGGRPLRVFMRLEYQDGTHKEGTKRYEGSGRPHIHVLVFGDDFDNTRLAEFVSAATPLEPDLRGKVLCSQQDKYGDSKWPLRNEPSCWDERAQTLHLQHSAADEANGVHRAYIKPIMAAFPCHQDLQVSDGEGLLLQYVTKYVSKFSDAAYKEWLSDETEADVLARRVCHEYHPMEPEMYIQLSGGQFKEWSVNSESKGKKSIVAPYPGMLEVPSYVQQYTKSQWRSDSMSLLEYLRKSTDRGDIIGWLQKAYQERVLEEAIEK
eukprot:12431328-Karenia_brevis.AAC.1